MHSSSALLKGYLFVIISSIADSTIPIIGKIAYAYSLTPVQLFFIRHFFAFIVIAVILLPRGKHVICLSPQVLAQGLLLFIQELLFYYSLEQMPASIATIIFYTYPILVAMLAIVLFKEKSSLVFFLGLILAVLGIAIMSGLFCDSIAVSLKGLVMCAFSALLFAFFTLLSQKTTVDIEPLQLIGTFSLICFVASIFIAPHDIFAITDCTVYQLGLGCAASIINNLLGLLAFLKAITYLGASRTSLGCTIEPVIGVMLAVVLLHEPFTYAEVIGAAMVICSIIMSLKTGSVH
ncbi:MAG: DMT family transporter [Syntrophomonadaceae bacterium]|nr:DMT family transporter [Syntrophomonadaceae bacterium]MDD4549025.1 DMT family transporter [Syntrophomonadaceae bacterium]